MAGKTAIVLECDTDRESLREAGIDVTERTTETRFGKLTYLRAESSAQVGLVFENGGMNDRRPFSRAMLPVFTVAYREGVETMFSLGFAGSLTEAFGHGDFVIPDDVLDGTRDRPRSFVEEFSPGELFFYRMAEPFSPDLRAHLEDVVADLGFTVHDGGVHAVTEGPRFETAAEIAALRQQGTDTVSFSGVPEAYFARELDIEFGVGGFVSNAGEGLDDLYADDILDAADEQGAFLTEITARLLTDPYEASGESYHEQYWMQTPDETWDAPLEDD